MSVKFFVLPECRPPVRRDTDAGWDLFVRAVVYPRMSKEVPHLRDTMFDFEHTIILGNTDSMFLNQIVATVDDQCAGRYYYTLRAGESLSLGLGVVVELPPSSVGYVKPRSSTIRTEGRDCRLEIANEGVPIDPGFRGEIWAELVNHGPDDFALYKDACLAQLVVHRIRTECEYVSDWKLLSRSRRHNGSHGSTNRK